MQLVASMKVVWVFVLLAPAAVHPLKVAAWNIKTFGTAKMDKAEVVSVLVNTISRWDIVCIQEIRNADGTAIEELLDLINAANNNEYSLEISERLGTSSYKEQYGFLYRNTTVSVTATLQYKDGTANYNDFIRPPFAVRFSAPAATVTDFGMMCNHAKPDNAVSEIDKLVDAYNCAADAWGIRNFVIAGDFNADCTYVGTNDWASIRLKSDSCFDWKIDDSADTTVGTTDCAYDRIVIAGESLKAAAATSGSVYDFKAAGSLNQTQADAVSDHYPVEIDI